MPVKFRKQLIAAESFESAGVYDVNGDGKPDIVSGSFWYEWPDYRKRHWMGDIFQQYQYHDDFSTIGLDVNGDGRVDIVSGGWFEQKLRWHENPGGDKEWPVHVIDEPGNIETTRAWDVDGDGQLEIVPNTPGAPLCVYKLVTDAAGKGTGKFRKHVVFDQPHGHGLGFGDVNGDGRGDFVITKGWVEQPREGLGGKWTFHPELDLSHGYNGQFAKVIAADPARFAYAVPGEGATFWLDSLCVPTSARHPDNALAFIEYVLDPQVSAQIANAVGYGSPNAAARKFIKKEMLDNPVVYPPEDVLKRCQFMEDVGETARVLDKYWTEIKAQ